MAREVTCLVSKGPLRGIPRSQLPDRATRQFKSGRRNKRSCICGAFHESVSMAGLELLSRHRVGGSVILVVQQPGAQQPIACLPSDVGLEFGSRRNSGEPPRPLRCASRIMSFSKKSAPLDFSIWELSL